MVQAQQGLMIFLEVMIPCWGLGFAGWYYWKRKRDAKKKHHKKKGDRT